MSEKDYNKCVDNYADMLFKYFVKNISDNDSAQDLTQDTFYALWKTHHTVEITKAKAFLFITAHNLMVNHIKYTAQQRKMKNEYHTTEEYFEDNSFETGNLVNHLIEKLPAMYKEVIVLKDLQGFSYKQIAQLTQMTEENVKVSVFRARCELKKLLKSIK